MILAINYSDERFKSAQRLNSAQALKMGADKVIEYTYETLPEDFKKKYEDRFRMKRGGGYWIWKPFIILDALSKAEDGDFVVYTDSGSAFVNRIQFLIDAMEQSKTDIMAFCINTREQDYSKRDAFILMDCDTEEIRNSAQICGGYMIIKKNLKSCLLMKQFMYYVADERVVTDQDNVMGKDNYEGFIENRHDQTVFSLLCKKNGIQPFRDPSEHGLNSNEFTDDVNQRSNYPQIIESHRREEIHSAYQLKYNQPFQVIKRKIKKMIEV